jgi:hypothetical protein
MKHPVAPESIKALALSEQRVSGEVTLRGIIRDRFLGGDAVVLG